MIYEKKILLVDDERGLLEILKLAFNKERFLNITCAYNAVDALALIKSNNYDVIILDVVLPDFSGFDLCTEIRKITYTPVIFLTACAGDLDKITGLTLGGDDYITKPFNPLEVVVRTKAILRRQNEYINEAKESTIFEYDSFKVDVQRGILEVNNKLVECTAKEFELLKFFCKNPERVFTLTQIYEAVWGFNEIGIDKTVTIHISKLRKKLNDDSKMPKIIVNLRGIGYKFIPPVKGGNK